MFALLAACDRGTVQLDIGDAPVDDADRVVVQFTGVTLERTDGSDESVTFNPPKSIDLAAQVEGATAALLDGNSIEEGDFEAVRLRVSADGSGTDSFVEVGGIARPLLLDDVDLPKLRIARSFTVVRQEEIRLVVDFDLRKSVHTPDSGIAPYELRPSLRIVEPEDTGAIAGTVTAALAGAGGCHPAVYVFTGHSATANDEGSPLPPFASAIVRAAGPNFFYRVPFLPAGNYTAAFTCNAGADDPEADDSIVFTGTRNVTVADEADVTANFP